MIPEHYLTEERFRIGETVEASEDFILPDYMAEVQRIVGVTATVTQDDTFLEGDYLETEGSVLYTVLYQSSDKSLASAPLTSRYTCRIPLNRQEGDGFGVEDVVFRTGVDNVVCRVSAPRKLSLSSKVRMQCFSLSSTFGGHKIESSEEDTASVICCSRTVPIVEVKTIRQTGIAEGNIREREGSRVISCVGNVCIQDVKIIPKNGEIRVTGEANVQLLLASPDGSYIQVRDRCPTEDILRLEALRSLGNVKTEKDGIPEGTASAVCAAVEVTCSDNGEIGWKMEYDTDCVTAMPGRSEITVDGYSTTCHDDCTFRTTQVCSLGRCINGRLTLAGEKQIRTEDMRYIYGFGRGTVTGGETQNGRLILTGSAVLTGVLVGNGEVTAEECTIPLRYECEAGEGIGEYVCQCNVVLFDVGGRVDGDRLHMNAEAGINGICLCKHTENSLANITLRDAEPFAKKRPAITLYTPDEDDTDWTVQKRYRVCEENIERINEKYLIRKL